MLEQTHVFVTPDVADDRGCAYPYPGRRELASGDAAAIAGKLALFAGEISQL